MRPGAQFTWLHAAPARAFQVTLRLQGIFQARERPGDRTTRSTRHGHPHRQRHAHRLKVKGPVKGPVTARHDGLRVTGRSDRNGPGCRGHTQSGLFPRRNRAATGITGGVPPNRRPWAGPANQVTGGGMRARPQRRAQNGSRHHADKTAEVTYRGQSSLLWGFRVGGSAFRYG